MKINLIKVQSFIRRKTLLAIMRTFIFLLCTTVFSFSGEKSFSQEQVTIDADKVISVDEVFNIIQNQTKYRFLYPQDLFVDAPKVKLKKGTIRVSKLLNHSFAGNNVNFELAKNNTIVIKEKPITTVNNVDSKVAQGKTVSGTVTDVSGMALPGVNVLQKGTGNGAVSDFDGNYKLTLIPGSEVLVVSYIGYKTVEQSVGGKTTLNITLEESAEGLDEVVIVGYGTQKKVNLTGAVGIASGEVLENRPITTVGRGLQGVIPGLNITVNNGDPAGGVDFNIRGFESINGGSPLILVDNVPMDLNQINPNDIESISVLKDAAAAAIYGARAAFGVVLVTTKKGKKGKTRVTLSTEQTVNTPIFLIEPIENPHTYMANVNERAVLNGGNPRYNATRLAEALAYSQNPTFENAWSIRDKQLYYNGFNDYQNKVITNQSPQKKYDLSVSGASDDASYYASFGYLGKEGYLVSDRANQNFERFNALLKADFKVNNWLSLNSQIIYTNTTNETPTGAVNDVNRISPIEPLFFPDLESYLTPGDRADFTPFIGRSFLDNRNAISEFEEGFRNTSTKHDTWFKQGITITPVEGFVLKSDFSYNVNSQYFETGSSKVPQINGGNFTDGIDLTNLLLVPHNNDDHVSYRTQYNQYFAFNIFGEYTYDKIENHTFKAMVGYNQEELRTRRSVAKRNDLITPDITDIEATTGDQFAEGGRSHVALRGAFFRFNYDYKGKYLLEVNGRYDGTSRFPKEDRFGFFPSFSAGWRISEESFMASTSDWLTNLKIRGSYGELGNQIYTENGQQNYYPYVPALTPSSTDYDVGNGPLSRVEPADLVSPTLTWESVNTRNLGLDASFIKGKLNVTADVYVRETKDMLLRVNLPDILGAPEPLQNGADLETKGWELAINWRSNIGNDWKYGIGFNISDNQTKITKYGGKDPSINSFYVGKDIGEIWGFESVGLFESDAAVGLAPNQDAINKTFEEGDMQYADLNGDGIVDRGLQRLITETGEFDKGDLKVIGNSNARYSFGITPSVEYKGLSLNMFFQGVGKKDYYPNTGPHAGFWPYNGSLVTQDFIENSWSPTNPNAYFARPRGTGQRNIQPQTRYLQNAAYIRLKNLTINYNFQQDLVEKIGMSNASVFIAGQNLWEYTKMHPTLDPEQTPSGILLQQYTFERSLSLGLKIGF